MRSVFFAGWLLLGLTLVTALHLVGLLIGYTRGRAMDIVLREADGEADNADEWLGSSGMSRFRFSDLRRGRIFGTTVGMRRKR